VATLYFCSLEDARRVGMTVIHISPNGREPAVPLPKNPRGLKALVRKVHREADWRGFNRFAPPGMVMVRKMRLVGKNRRTVKLIEVSIGSTGRGEEMRIM